MGSPEFDRRWGAFRDEKPEHNTPQMRHAFLMGWSAMWEQIAEDEGDDE